MKKLKDPFNYILICQVDSQVRDKVSDIVSSQVWSQVYVQGFGFFASTIGDNL